MRYQHKYDYWLGEDHGFFDTYYQALPTQNPIKTIASVSIKQELRTTLKIKENNVRTVASVDVNHLVAHNMLCGEMNEKLKENVLRCPSALGMSLMYAGAQSLFNFLSAWGDVATMFDMDGKKYDARFHLVAFGIISRFRGDCLYTDDATPQNKQRILELYNQICTAPLIDIDGHVYERESGNLSGQGSTTEDNIIKNFLDFGAYWIVLAPPHLRTSQAFSKHTRILFVGDDVICSVDPTCTSFYNPKMILGVCARFGMEYTGDMNLKRFSECEFVGHTYKLTILPGGKFSMYLPHIDCTKMRTAMVRNNPQAHNVDPMICLYNSIVRCAGLRAETFACESCRTWFSQLFWYLVAQLPTPHTRDAISALTTYKSDTQMWELYTGIKSADMYSPFTGLPGAADKYQPLPPLQK
jgi:hypothetical protein